MFFHQQTTRIVLQQYRMKRARESSHEEEKGLPPKLQKMILQLGVAKRAHEELTETTLLALKKQIDGVKNKELCQSAILSQIEPGPAVVSYDVHVVMEKLGLPEIDSIGSRDSEDDDEEQEEADDPIITFQFPDESDDLVTKQGWPTSVHELIQRTLCYEQRVNDFEAKIERRFGSVEKTLEKFEKQLIILCSDKHVVEIVPEAQVVSETQVITEEKQLQLNEDHDEQRCALTPLEEMTLPPTQNVTDQC